MNLLEVAGDLFKVETLDERFLPDKPPSPEPKKPLAQRLELVFRVLVDSLFVFAMFRIAMSAADPQVNSKYFDYKILLSPGWMGPEVDNTDSQYAGFRSNLGVLLIIMTLHCLFRVLLRFNKGQKRSYYDFVTSLHVFGLHGTGGFKIFIIVVLNYYIGKWFRNRTASWIFLMTILFANEFTEGFYTTDAFEFGSLLPHWHVFFKCTLLRMLSFNVDRLEADQAQTELEPKPIPNREEYRRTGTPRPLEEYNFINYVGYCLYLPLYIGGPIITFNDFRSQISTPTTGTSVKRVIMYAIRFVFCFLVLEFILHNIPAPAMIKARAWVGLSPAQISMISFFGLIIIWLKLLIPWRMFRLWALVDRIDPPENMVRCVSNNYSTSSFWRSWHRSFNKWAIRYIYLPLGGAKHSIRNAAIVFFFVALWHDMQLNLFVWGFLSVIFVLPEAICKFMFPNKIYNKYWWWKYVCGVGGVLNIWAMLLANLVGFAIGVDGAKMVMKDLAETSAGLWFVILSSIVLFEGTQCMFDFRARELRRGIDMKC
ncbi:O-acyltransferase [Starmerella bacillaris]|uniref:O-acyltransferase n=1 Tax=Starmerella bacillaris TaxID=1247836 RepID=A0AAV5RD91_STABA|nr:O-acyltransferase [Starmerella bacillaris]